MAGRVPVERDIVEDTLTPLVFFGEGLFFRGTLQDEMVTHKSVVVKISVRD